LICKSIEFLDLPDPTSPRPNAIIRLPSLVLTFEIKAHKREISALQADRGWLAGSSGQRSESTKRDYRIRDPKFFGLWLDGLFFYRF
jgi:hypothetical protein